ncbi:MAG: type I glyceraldehyde-3-phosphate dehydrogenase [Desulfobulbaceae bacterium]|nr:type I glyceraldehyde-3-phosphate dehydrogenase [Desulfobulbaceae bacterium]
MAIKIAINGFGRIGRQITRLLSSGFGAGIELLAVNSLEPIDIAAHLLKYDSNHGPFPGSVAIEKRELVLCGGPGILFLNQADPRQLPWQEMGIDLVIEASGHATERQQANLHLLAGAAKVLITAAAHDPDITLCMGVNHQSYRPQQHHIISGSSCTTNCLAPAAKLINDHFHITTCLSTFLHSYTSNQPLLDLAGHDLRRMRGAGRNIIPTSTSSVQQIPEVIPELTDKFDAIAIRVPTPQVHLASFTALIEHSTTATKILDRCLEASTKQLQGILDVSDVPLVSTDYQSSDPSCVIDAGSIKVMDNMLQLMIWHDNESSYCKRMLDLVRYIGLT